MQAQAWRTLGRAVHLCPWDGPQRVALASAALRSGPARAPAARRLCSDPRLDCLAPRGSWAVAGTTSGAARQRPTSQVSLVVGS